MSVGISRNTIAEAQTMRDAIEMGSLFSSRSTDHSCFHFCNDRKCADEAWRGENDDAGNRVVANIETIHEDVSDYQR